MADPHHLEILRSGRAAWNAWRQSCPEVRPDLSQADLSFMNLTGFNLSQTDVTNAKAYGLRVNSKFARGLVRGMTGFDTVEGAPLFVKAVAEAQFLDALEVEVNANYPFAWTDNGPQWMRRLWASVQGPRIWTLWRVAAGIFCAIFGSLNNVTARGGVALGLALTMILRPELVPNFYLGAQEFLLGLGKLLWGGADWIVFGLLISSIIAGWPGRRFFLWMWDAVFDFGKDWYAVVAFAGLNIVVFGAIYAVLGPQNIQFVESNGHPLFPWFVAAMGFCTLGVTGMAKALSGLAMLVMTLNVVAGFVTLGLLIAVLGQNFSGRS